jgi:hypothetical protein
MKLVKRYSPERLESACHRALMLKGYSYKSVKSILKNGLDQQPLLFEQKEAIPRLLNHPNVRGNEYYTGKEACHA